MPKALRHLTRQLLALANFLASFVLAGLQPRARASAPRAKRKASPRAKAKKAPARKAARRRA